MTPACNPFVSAHAANQGVRLGICLLTLTVTAAAMLTAFAGPSLANAHATPMPRIHVEGTQVLAGQDRWRAYGFNWHTLPYFDHPTRKRLGKLRGQLADLGRVGATSMRIAIELGQVMRSEGMTRPAVLRGLRGLLTVAERERIYLDITGNVNWRVKKVPAWYDRLSEQRRWNVQARFWTAVAAAAHGSPAVLCYELTSEPFIGEDPQKGYYQGVFGGYAFVQAVAFRNGRDAGSLARAWTKKLAGAVRARDDRPVTIGLLPFLAGAFGPGNLADLLDILTVHEYPHTGEAQRSIDLVHGFARHGRPVLLGETALLWDDLPTQEAFLVGAAPYMTAGSLEFYDGRLPADINPATASIGDALYRGGVAQYLTLRPKLLD